MFQKVIKAIVLLCALSSAPGWAETFEIDAVTLQKSSLVAPARFQQTATRPALHQAGLDHAPTVADQADVLVTPVSRPPTATLMFTATHLRKGYRGSNVGTGSLHVFESGSVCRAGPPRAIQAPQVTAEAPVARIQIPADRPLSLSSMWSAGGAHCLLGNYAFTPEQGAIYRLTNVQNRSEGVCHLRLQRLQVLSGRFEDDVRMRPSSKDCQLADASLQAGL